MNYQLPALCPCPYFPTSASKGTMSQGSGFLLYTALNNIYLHEAESSAKEGNFSGVSPGVSRTCIILANYVCEKYICVCVYACMLRKSQLSKILHASADLKYHCNNSTVLEWAGTKTVVRPWFNFGKIKFPVALRGKLSTLDLGKPHESAFGFVKPYLKPEVFWI